MTNIRHENRNLFLNFVLVIWFFLPILVLSGLLPTPTIVDQNSVLSLFLAWFFEPVISLLAKVRNYFFSFFLSPLLFEPGISLLAKARNHLFHKLIQFLCKKMRLLLDKIKRN